MAASALIAFDENLSEELVNEKVIFWKIKRFKTLEINMGKNPFIGKKGKPKSHKFKQLVEDVSASWITNKTPSTLALRKYEKLEKDCQNSERKNKNANLSGLSQISMKNSIMQDIKNLLKQAIRIRKHSKLYFKSRERKIHTPRTPNFKMNITQAQMKESINNEPISMKDVGVHW